jgi:hypothetical protein
MVPEWVMHKAMRVMPKLQQTSQDIEGARNVEYFLRISTGSEQSQLRREAIWAAKLKGLPKPL